MSSQLLIGKEPKDVKVVLDRNGYRRAKLDETEDYDGRIITLAVPEEEYRYLHRYSEEIDLGLQYDHVEQIFRNALVGAGIPSGYRVLAVFKDSFNGKNE